MRYEFIEIHLYQLGVSVLAWKYQIVELSLPLLVGIWGSPLCISTAFRYPPIHDEGDGKLDVGGSRRCNVISMVRCDLRPLVKCVLEAVRGTLNARDCLKSRARTAINTGTIATRFKDLTIFENYIAAIEV